MYDHILLPMSELVFISAVVTAFQRMKQEFDFNISASVSFDLDANSSRSLQEMTQHILEDVSSEVQLLLKLKKLLAYVGLVLLTWSFLRSVQHQRNKRNHETTEVIQMFNIMLSP